jgi:hypothetical protein
MKGRFGMSVRRLTGFIRERKARLNRLNKKRVTPHPTVLFPQRAPMTILGKKGGEENKKQWPQTRENLIDRLFVQPCLVCSKAGR